MDDYELYLHSNEKFVSHKSEFGRDNNNRNYMHSSSLEQLLEKLPNHIQKVIHLRNMTYE
jgi:hypothetical protein